MKFDFRCINNLYEEAMETFLFGEVTVIVRTLKKIAMAFIRWSSNDLSDN